MRYVEAVIVTLSAVSVLRRYLSSVDVPVVNITVGFGCLTNRKQLERPLTTQHEPAAGQGTPTMMPGPVINSNGM